MKWCEELFPQEKANFIVNYSMKALATLVGYRDTKSHYLCGLRYIYLYFINVTKNQKIYHKILNSNT